MVEEVQAVHLNEVPLKKVVAAIGDGEGTRFSVEHPAAPNVIAHLYRAVGGEPISADPTVQDKFIIFSFALPPKQDEFIAVVIG